jgi:hypothetical protein
MADIVAIQNIAPDSKLMEVEIDRIGKGGFPGTGETCEPKNAAFVLV